MRFLLTLTYFLSSYALASGPESPSPIAAQWQTTMVEEAAKELKIAAQDSIEAWGLFSMGGWSDNGQIFFLKRTRDKKVFLYRVKPNGSNLEPRSKVEAKKFKDLEKVFVKADKLESVLPVAFDALTYEYVHLVMKKGETLTTHRMLIRDLGEKPLPEHRLVIEAFQKFQ